MSSPGRLVLGWCALYTLAAPEDHRHRRREEIRSHVWETLDAQGHGWRTRARLTAACLRGAWSDLVWCDEVRREAGGVPLPAALLIGPTGSTFIAGVLIVTAYLVTLIHRPDSSEVTSSTPDRVVALVAAAVLAVSWANRAVARFRQRGRS